MLFAAGAVYHRLQRSLRGRTIDGVRETFVVRCRESLLASNGIAAPGVAWRGGAFLVRERV
jgi:hypothetical protein